jgi:NAD-dependent DNA ligase
MVDFSKMNTEEPQDLLDRAKDAYYNSGEELLSDAEYDELEKRLGLENKNYVGSKRGNYDVKHAFIMGSLAKTQVKEKDGFINWEECADQIESFLRKSNGAKYFETTPKLDGCSFSAEFLNRKGKAYLQTVATRGNGEWGTDIKFWFKPVLESDYWSKINEAVSVLCKENSNDILCIRGEVLMPNTTFSEKYVNQYANPRAFSAGILGTKVDGISEDKILAGKDLHFVCYDYRLVKNGEFEELSWMNPNDPTYSMLTPYLNHIGELPDKEYCQVHKFDGIFTEDDLKEIYNEYDHYRKEESEYPLDGIVFKPECSARKHNINRPRPVDCIAMKFMPMINPTEIINIEWKVGKTGEYFPKAIFKPIMMEDGKKITRASMHNYGWVVANNCGIGSTVRVSLAGDIIPFVYEIVDHVDAENNMNLPADTYIRTEPSGAKHLMKKFSENEEQRNKFVSSVATLNINSIGPAAAEELYDALNEEVPELTNIIYLMNNDCYKKIYDILDDSKSIQNYVNNLKQYAAHISLVDIIKSFNFKSCGTKAAEVCARIISGLPYQVNSLPRESYAWALDPNSRQLYMVTKAMEDLDVELMEDDSNSVDKIPIIMTGSPSNFGYATKAKFLQAHPEYVETTDWKSCKILFTDDLSSNSGKMQRAKKQGVEIKTYGDVDGNNSSSNNFDFNKPQSTSEELF